MLRPDREGAGRGSSVYLLLDLPSARVVRAEVRYHMERVGLGVEFAGQTDENRDDLRTLVDDFAAALGTEGA